MLYIAYAILYLLIFSFGCVIFSFLNVVAYRLPRGLSPFKGRSNCTSCSHQLHAVDLIPILSYLSLKGRCRYCGARFSPRYVLTEAAGGVIAALLFARFGLPLFLFYFAVAGVLAVVALADFDVQEIPDSTHIALAVLGIVSIWVGPEVKLLSRIIGVFCVSVPFLILAMTLGAFGGGDIKLMAAAGFLLGWQNTLLAALIGIVLGGLVAVIMLAAKKAGRKTQIAFGPYLCVGIFTALLFGSEIIGWYISFF
ncbi:prepilin peptidase [Eubacteriales bacterium OttesenSCG-928-K08]|nr:prepilin peptidase [Eubacteriales bacterium OttesenSCG-928-K08]